MDGELPRIPFYGPGSKEITDQDARAALSVYGQIFDDALMRHAAYIDSDESGDDAELEPRYNTYLEMRLTSERLSHLVFLLCGILRKEDGSYMLDIDVTRHFANSEEEPRDICTYTFDSDEQCVRRKDHDFCYTTNQYIHETNYTQGQFNELIEEEASYGMNNRLVGHEEVAALALLLDKAQPYFSQQQETSPD